MINSTINLFKNKQSKKKFRDDFKSNNPIKKRQEESNRIIVKYPNRVPIICEPINYEIEQIDRKKYLCPKDLSLANFLLVIRKRLKLSPEKALYLFINKKLVPYSQLLGTIYEENKNEDGFLYINYAGESTFG
jgi:GABA(A) receptor-associated protein